MRFLCFGIGAIGTYFGGSLASSGHEVVFVERPEVAAFVKQEGLSLQFQNEVKTIRSPQILNSLDEALAGNRYDLALLAIKSFDTQTFVHDLGSNAEKMPPVLCLQNGVENEALLSGALGPDKVIPASVTTAIGRKEPGKIVVERLRGVGIAGQSQLVPRIIDAFNQSGLKAHRYPDPASMKWSKMLTNLLANASSAILDMTPAQIFSDAGLYRMELRMFKEALQVMDALEILVTDLPGTPVKLLVWIVRSLPAALSQPLLVNALGKGRGTKMPSFHIDLRGGRGKSEVDYLNGAVVRFGAKAGIPTPVNRWLNETLMGLSSGTIALDRYAHAPASLLSEIASLK